MPKKLTKADERLIHIATQIEEKPPQGNDLAFQHSQFASVALPRSKVDGDEYLAESGNRWIYLQAGMLDEGNGPVRQPIPYGPMPRLALAWLSTYAIRWRSPEIPIGQSATQFLRMMGFDGDGRRHRTLRAQMHALAACRFQMGVSGRTYSGQPIEQFDAWAREDDCPGQRSLWPGVLTLSPSYYETLINHAVPLDDRALMALRGSSLALDVYTWLANRLHRMEGRAQILYWKPLRAQFGQGYADPKNFQREFKATLHRVLMVYPQARVSIVKGGLRMMASPPPVARK
ncbi:replication protein RepA (plasmid) [Guyparkeria sp. 1SP6A2]|nr:replication protein RepA [Guyparkeria sp. 1SP6A2]